jgi:RNA polymerase sigma-70 factor (ECF subfamily)
MGSHRHSPGEDAEQTLRRLFTNHQQRVLAYAIRRGASFSDAQDVVGETFAVAWRRVGSLPSGDLELAWLYGVAARVLANQRRSQLRSASLWSRLRLAAASAPPTDEAGVVEVREVLSAMKQLRPRDQEVLRLAAWEGLSLKELAVTLRCTENAAALRLHRARRRLVVELEKGNPSAGHLLSRRKFDSQEAP